MERILIDKRLVPLFIVSAIGLVVIGGLASVASRVDQAREEFYDVQKKLELYRAEIWDMGTLDREQLQIERAQLNARFSNPDDLAPLIGELTELAKTLEISLDSLVPREVQEGIQDLGLKSVPLDRVPIELKVKGTYQALSGFMKSLTELHSGVVYIEDFKLNRGEKAEGPLTCSINVYVFIRKSPDQDVLSGSFEVEEAKQGEKVQSRFSDIQRDPFQRVQRFSVREFRLEGIIYDPAAPLALIDGEVKQVGDRVQGAVIREIKPDSVVFEKGTQRVNVRLKDAKA